MGLTGLIGKKTEQTQGFLQDGTRVPLTVVSAMGNVVAQIKTMDHDQYNSIKLGFEKKKKGVKAEKETFRFFREVEGEGVEAGSSVSPSEVFKPGDIVDVIGVSKGKGFAGVVKRHHFKGGPRTHGQSDRERAPGSIGQTTTPGHVYRGKRMAGHMGHGNVTVKNLEVIDITNDGAILIKGLVPGGVNSIVVIKKVGESKKFVPLYKEEVKTEEVPQSAEEIKTEAPVEEVKIEEQVQAPAEEPKEEVKEESAESVQPEEKKEEVSADAKAIADKKEDAS